MALLPIDTLIRGLSVDEALETLHTTLEKVNIPSRRWRDGGTAKALLGVLAGIGSIGSNLVADGIKGGFLEWATGEWARVLARLQYGVEPIGASYATGKLTVTNIGTQVRTWGPDEMIAKSSVNGRRYRISTAANDTPGFPALEAGESLVVDIVAVEPGSASSASPGDIDSLETPLTDVIVGNGEAVVGTDDETIEALKARCYARPGTQSANGPRDAYVYAIFEAKLPGGTPTSINRVSVQPARGDAIVRIVIATANGAPTPLEMQAARDSIELLARTDTDIVELYPAVEVEFENTITVWRRGGSEAVIRAAIAKRLPSFFATYPIGGIKKISSGNGYLYADAVESMLIGSDAAIFDVDQSNGDLELEFNEVPVMTGTILVREAAK